MKPNKIKESMTPKERANELGNKFYRGSVFDHDKVEHLNEIKRAKECARICVETILEVVTTIADKKYDYYTEVLAEIDLL